MVNDSGHPLLADFVHRTAGLSDPDSVVERARYTAPEVVSGLGQECTKQGDVYVFSSLAMEVCTTHAGVVSSILDRPTLDPDRRSAILKPRNERRCHLGAL